MTMSHSWRVMDEDSSSQEFKDVDRLATICSFHNFIGKKKGKTERGGGWRCCSKAAAFAKTGFRLGFRNQCGQHEREAREVLGPSRSRVEFPQKWPVGRGKTAWWQ